jgi:hypothetical protein
MLLSGCASWLRLATASPYKFSSSRSAACSSDWFPDSYGEQPPSSRAARAYAAPARDVASPTSSGEQMVGQALSLEARVQGPRCIGGRIRLSGSGSPVRSRSLCWNTTGDGTARPPPAPVALRRRVHRPRNRGRCPSGPPHHARVAILLQVLPARDLQTRGSTPTRPRSRSCRRCRYRGGLATSLPVGRVVLREARPGPAGSEATAAARASSRSGPLGRQAADTLSGRTSSCTQIGRGLIVRAVNSLRTATRT